MLLPPMIIIWRELAVKSKGLIEFFLSAPAIYVSGTRFMVHFYQNAKAICRYRKRPTLFITFSVNPKWKEIKDELLHSRTASDCPDLVVHVFCYHFVSKITNAVPHTNSRFTVEHSSITLAIDLQLGITMSL